MLVRVILSILHVALLLEKDLIDKIFILYDVVYHLGGLLMTFNEVDHDIVGEREMLVQVSFKQLTDAW